MNLILMMTLVFSATANAEQSNITVGGFVKANYRIVSGDLAYQHSWAGSSSFSEDQERTQFSAQESRLNVLFNSEDTIAFAEIDFSNSSQGNPVISNSYSPRLRHFYLKYKNLLAGQTWSTFVNTSTYAETADLGGPLVGETLIRQAQIRYSYNNWQFSLENPYTYGTKRNSENSDWIDTGKDFVPDFIVRYNFDGDWGNISISSLLRYLDPSESKELGAGFSIAAKLMTFGNDDIRIQINYGNLGRYVGTAAAKDIVDGQKETSKSGMFAYRHIWTKDSRSTVFWGHTSTDVEKINRDHWGINYFTDFNSKLTVGIELGRFDINDGNKYRVYKNGFSNYAQMTIMYKI